MHRINLLSLTVPIKHNATVPIKRTAPSSTLQIVKKMENPKGNPLLAAIKQFADNPQKLQEELKKLVNEGQEKLCGYLVDMLALKDKNTAEHMRGAARIATKFAKEIGLSPQKTEEIRVAALVHDIGKIFTPLNVLNKPGKLNEAERAIMAEHAPLGKKFLKQLGLTKINKTFDNASELAEKHHFSIDKLHLTKKRTVEEEVLELSDVFNALTKRRSYHKPQTPKEALRIMKNIQKVQRAWSPEFFEKFTKFVEKTYCKK
ncbi:MAG: hypothetical protein A2039_01710 [Candidatus Melainabacteria bacterium GWA2_34_9]|nr:MAG: hypothetical protein A2039_01710 [Candidatus Melainabacteria bacterium GWA2_34_9]